MTTTAPAPTTRSTDRRLRRRLGGARRRPDRRPSRRGRDLPPPLRTPSRSAAATRSARPSPDCWRSSPTSTFVEQELISGDWGWVVRWTMSGTLAEPYPGRKQGRRARLAVRDRRPRHDHGRRRQADRQAHVPRLAGGARSAGTRMSAATGSAAATRTAAEWVAGVRRGLAGAGRRRPSAPTSSRCSPTRSGCAAAAARAVGKRAFREEFARPLFALLHDVRGTVGSWAATDGRRRDRLHRADDPRQARRRASVTLHTIDRITLRDGVAVERSPTSTRSSCCGVALSPRSWPTFLRARLGR